ncbi:MAG: hypothetical protein M3Q71_14975 [Chloroflexota bacterium]|nr:hypothetical protein [Chloroflexota bacterium]
MAIKYITRKEGRKLFDYQSRKTLGMSGEEFLRRYDAGEYQHLGCGSEEGRKIQRLAMLIPFARARTGE